MTRPFTSRNSPAAGVPTSFFSRERYDRALQSISRKLHEGTSADYCWLPELIEIGGFEYERGCRNPDEWSALMSTLLGGSVAGLLRETWEAIPRCAAERFGALMRDCVSEHERAQISQAYRRLHLSQPPVTQDVLVTSGFAPPCATDPPQRPLPARGKTHEHTCESCGFPFVHEAWQCEPPEDRYCPLCAEQVAGPMPVWIERWNNSQDEDDGHRAVFSAEKSSGGEPPSNTGDTAKDVAHDAAARDVLSVPALPTECGLAKVAGMDDLKALLYEQVVSALRHPDDLKRYGLTIPNGVLLFGPPGCGKTYISRQLAEEMNYFFKEVFPSEIGSTFIHETTLKIREVFDTAAEHTPAIVFVDEFESMVPARRQLGAHQHHTAEEVSEFLKQLETCAQRGILLIAATNEPWKIDRAVLRTGRLDKLIYVPAPDEKARTAMLRFHLYGRLAANIDVAKMAEPLAGYSASDIKLLVDEAARMAYKARVPISENHLQTAAHELVHASVTARDHLMFVAFGQRGAKTSTYMEKRHPAPAP